MDREPTQAKLGSQETKYISHVKWIMKKIGIGLNESETYFFPVLLI